MTHRLGSRVGSIAILCAAALGPLSFAPTPAAAVGPTVSGVGSSFAGVAMAQWRAEVAKAPYKLSINYSAQGSSAGRLAFINNTHDFGASDIPFTAQELSQVTRAFAYVPVSAGGLGFMYNLKDTAGSNVTNLNLTRRAACRIFTEPGILWNDPEIAAVNPTLALPDKQILPIVRSDGSGTSYVFSEYCLTVAPDIWGVFVARLQNDPTADEAFKAGLPTSVWPATGSSQAAATADGVSAAVADLAGLYSITYNEAGYADIRGFPNANIQNAANEFVQPTATAVSIALAAATARPNGTFLLDYDLPDPSAYFPATYSYVIAPTTGFDPAKGSVLAKFLCYSVTRGQRVELMTALQYAPLSASLVEIARNAIAQIPGAPPWDQCAVGDPVPPPVVSESAFVALPALAALAGGALFVGLGVWRRRLITVVR